MMPRLTEVFAVEASDIMKRKMSNIIRAWIPRTTGVEHGVDASKAELDNLAETLADALEAAREGRPLDPDVKHWVGQLKGSGMPSKDIVLSAVVEMWAEKNDVYATSEDILALVKAVGKEVK